MTTDELIFEEDERKPDEGFSLLLEAASRLNADEKYVIKEMIEGMLVKHQTRDMVNSLSVKLTGLN